MAELRELQRKLQSIRALREIVDAMRNLAATYVRRSEKALDAIRPYSNIVETALRATLDAMGVSEPPRETGSTAVGIVFASDQGLCGAYNNRVVARAMAFRREMGGETRLIAVGHRGYNLLLMRGARPILELGAPASLEGIKARVLGVAGAALRAYEEQGGRRLFFIYNAHAGMGRFRETVRQVLPARPAGRESTPSGAFRTEPILTAPPQELLGHFAREYFFIELYRALIESHASENGARLAAMTSATTNIDKRLADLTQQFQTVRQDSITAELLDVVGGAEALK